MYNVTKQNIIESLHGLGSSHIPKNTPTNIGSFTTREEAISHIEITYPNGRWITEHNYISGKLSINIE